MYFLDANAFYSYFGRNRLKMKSAPVDEKKLTNFLDKQKNKSIPTSVYIEIITHFRDEPRLLKEIFDFVSAKKIVFYNNIPNYVINPYEMKLVSYMDFEELSSYAYEILTKKIEIETAFTILFYEVTRNLYIDYKLKSVYNLSSEDKKSIYNFLGRKLYINYKDILKEEFTKILSNGYDANKEQKILKDFYIKKLNDACLFIDMIIDGCIAVRNEEIDIIKVIKETCQNDIRLGMDGQNGTMPYIVDKLAKDRVFLDEAKTEISLMIEKCKYSKTQSIYIRDVMFTAWFERGQKLQKNDIFDMFCVGCLDCDGKSNNKSSYDTKSYLITFDKRIKSFIESVKPNRIFEIDNL